MKKFRSLLAMMLMISLLASAAAFSVAEEQTEEWQADIRVLMSDKNVPMATSMEFDYSLPEETEVETHAHAIEKVGSDGSTMRIDIGMIYPGDLSKEEWEIFDEWLDETVSKSIQGIAADTESMAKAVSP